MKKKKNIKEGYEKEVERVCNVDGTGSQGSGNEIWFTAFNLTLDKLDGDIRPGNCLHATQKLKYLVLS